MRRYQTRQTNHLLIYLIDGFFVGGKQNHETTNSSSCTMAKEYGPEPGPCAQLLNANT